MNDDQSKLNPYRKVSTGTWADRKVTSLSALIPSGQAMWMMLLVGPQTTNMPGVQCVGRMAFAELLDWDLEAFDEAFSEVSEQGLAKADWKARFVFVPKAIQHNLPQSPNVVKSWASTWVRVPDCDLKREAWKTIYLALSELGDSFVAAFEGACPLDIEPTERCDLAAFDEYRKALRKPSGKTSPNQEQEQEQDKEQDKNKGSAGAPGVSEIPSGHPAGETDPAAVAPAGKGKVTRAAKASDKRTLTAEDLVALGADPVHAKDWLTARKAKKSPLTETALDGVKREAAKAGYTLPEAIERCAERGWVGFNAEWVPRKSAPQGQKQGERDVVTTI